LTVAARAVARHVGAVAHPREDRWHREPTALLGGVAIYGAFLVSFLAVAPSLPRMMPVLIAASLIFLLGLCDDLFHLKAPTKLVLQIAPALVLVAVGFRLRWTQNEALDDILTVFWLVGITNAVNLLDNMDGLAGGISVIASVFLATNFLLSEQPSEAFVPMALAGAILGFLVFNFKPASIFMGDSGSMFLGFMLAATSLLGEYGRSRSVFAVLFTPVLILLLPIFDTSLVTVTRKLAGRPISQGGRDHSSHRLVALGMSERQAVVRLYTIAVLSGCLALAVRFLRTEVALLLVPAFGLIVLFVGLYLGKVAVHQGAQVPPGSTILRALADFQQKRRVLEVSLDVVLVILAYWAAYLLRFDAILPHEQQEIFGRTAPLIIAVQMGCLLAGGVYRGLWRYVGIGDVVTIAKAVGAGALLNAVAVFTLYGFHGPSRSVFVLNGILLFVFVSGSRLSFRLLRVMILGRMPGHPGGKPMLIYGAGDGGELLLREILNNAEYGYTPVGFIDDDGRKAGKSLHGFPVYDRSKLVELMQGLGVMDVVISTTKVPEHQLGELRDMGVRLRKLRITLE
jgi:UDP-GlcNAc:undecaprenyl-phosphate GlcNAc-1-phosphate transferase